MPGPARRITGWLASPRLAATLLLLLGVLAFLGTLVPQGGPNVPKVAAWAAANPGLEPLVAAIGFHEAFSSPLFLIPVALLAASTVACAWRRTKVATRRYRLLRSMSEEDAARFVSRPTFSIAEGYADGATLASAESALRDLGMRTGREGGVVTACSHPFGVLGSPVFHWTLVAILLVLAAGRLTRSEGLMGVPVGSAVPDVAASYGVVESGALHRWANDPLMVRVDGLAQSYVVDGIDRGPAPTVTLVSPSGAVVSSGVVYPNNPLKYGSLMVHPSATGLAPAFALVSPQGREVARSTTLVDFSDRAPEGTSPGEFALAVAGKASVVATVTVSLQKQQGGFVQAVPATPRATFTIRPVGGGPPVASGTLGVGQDLALPDGSKLRLLGVGYYARLSVVDDWSVPVVYGLLVLGILAVAVSILARQSLAVVAIAKDDDGDPRLDVWFRDWRGGKARALEAEEAIRGAVEATTAKENGE